MTLSEFNPRLLNFLYELTKLDSYKSSAEIAKSIRMEGGRCITPKTVRNWFSYLRKPYTYKGYHLERKLSYFPGFFKNKLGLSRVHVYYEEPSPELVELFHLKDFVGMLYDPRTNKTVLAVEYVVPKENLGDFLGLLPKIREKGLCSDFVHYIIRSAYRIISPLHRVIDINGAFHPEKNDPNEVELQVKKLDKFLEHGTGIELVPIVRRNPLIIPVLAEYMYEHRSSVRVWEALKSKLGDSVWDYVKNFRRRSDGVGLKRVQGVMKNLNTFGLLNQMRMVYFPLEMKNLFIYTVFNFSSRDELLKKMESISLNSIIVNFFPIEGNKALLIYLVNEESMQKLFELLCSSDVEYMLFFDYFKSMELVTTTKYSIFDYVKMFDPKTRSWKYNQDEMLAELENLA